MTKKLLDALSERDRKSKPTEILGLLGIPLSGKKVVEVPNRGGFLYVRLRDNQSEVIQAHNNRVSPAYDLPVIVEREGNRYVIASVDTQRYSGIQGNDYSSYLPRHGNSHSFDTSLGGGGDVVWVDSQQFMPLLTMPSGSAGGPNVIISPFVHHRDGGDWKYIGNTGTESFTPYLPTGSSAVMGLVFVNAETGNPGIVINSGSYFSALLTGTNEIVPYLPSITDPNWIPDAAIRLVSGTSVIGWDNIYDVRQFISRRPTGTPVSSSSYVQSAGVPLGTANTFNFIGTNYDVSVSGSVARVFLTGSIGGAASVSAQDEGVPLGTASVFNFTGEGVTASISGTVVNVSVPYGGELSVGKLFYLTNTLQGIQEDAAYMYGLETNKATGGPYTGTKTAIGNADYTVRIHATDMLSTGFQTIVEGLFRFYVTAKQNSGTREVTCAVKLYKQDSAGTQTLLVTSNSTPAITSSYVTYELSSSGGPFALNVSDRLVVKHILSGGATGTDASVSLQYGNTDGERIEIPATNNVEGEISRTKWVPVSAVLTRTGNHTFTVVTDVSAYFRKGTKLRYKDGGAYEYGVVASTSYSSPTLTVTLISNTDYAMAAATLTDVYISYAENPEGWPGWFTWGPTYSASGSMTYTSVSTTVARWTLAGSRALLVRVQASGTTGGTANISLLASAPVTESGTASTCSASYADGGASSLGFSTISSGNLLCRKADSSNWGLGAGRVMNITVMYEF